MPTPAAQPTSLRGFHHIGGAFLRVGGGDFRVDGGFRLRNCDVGAIHLAIAVGSIDAPTSGYAGSAPSSAASPR